ncbi:MAG TPA: DUF2975 domain-containing protein [Clostridiaceae bacterium]
MFKLFDKYQKVGPLFLIFQLCLAISIIFTFTGVVFSILNILSLLPSGILKETWINIFLPSFQCTMGSIVFPVSIQSQYIPQILLYVGISNLPILLLLYYSCIQLKKVFRSFEVDNEPFTKANSILFKKIGIAITITIVVQFAFDFGYGAFLSLLINTYERSSSELTAVIINVPMMFTELLVASIFLGLASMFSRGVELKEDNDSIV